MAFIWLSILSSSIIEENIVALRSCSDSSFDKTIRVRTGSVFLDISNLPIHKGLFMIKYRYDKRYYRNRRPFLLTYKIIVEAFFINCVSRNIDIAIEPSDNTIFYFKIFENVIVF